MAGSCSATNTIKVSYFRPHRGKTGHKIAGLVAGERITMGYTRLNLHGQPQDILGESSLFQLLSTARTKMGKWCPARAGRCLKST